VDPEVNGCAGGRVLKFDVSSRSVTPPSARAQTESSGIEAALVVTDGLGAVSYWDKNAEALYGWSSEEAVGRQVREIMGDPEDLDGASEIRSHLMVGEPWEGVVRVHHKDGTVFDAYVRDVPLSQGGLLTGVVGLSVPAWRVENGIGGLGEHLDDRLTEFLAVERATRAAAAGAERWLEPYRKAARDALSQPALDAMLRAALEAIAHMLHADAASLLLTNDDGSELVARAAAGLGMEVELGLGIPAGSGVAGRVLSSGEPLIIGDLSKVEVASSTLRSSGSRSFVGVPLFSGRPLGVLHATSLTPEAFSQEDAELLALFAGPIASAIERVRLFEEEREARSCAEHASGHAERATERVRGLQRITASLASVSTIEEVCEVILDEAAPGLAGDAERGIWMLRDTGLLLVAGQGHSRDYPEIPLDPSLPAAENLRSGEPLFVESRAELAQRWPRLAEGPTASFAGLPLIVEGRRLGVMALGFLTEHVFEASERSYLATIAEQAAQALLRAEDRAALQAAHELAEERRERLDFLAHASERLAGSLDLEITLKTVAELGVPKLADRCALYLVEESRITKRVLAPELNDDELRLFESNDATMGAKSGVGAVIRTGRPEYFPRVEDSMLVAGARSDEELELLRRVGFGGLLLIPLRARGRNLGALAFVNRAGRDMPRSDRALAEELAARAALTIDNALLFRREAEVARRLSATLLPSSLPSIPGIDISARYEPGNKSFDIGGDFYDVWPVGPDTWLVMVGDVQGKGVEAAALTSFARYSIKSAAMSEQSPAALLRHLNEAVIRNILDTTLSPDNPWDDARLCTGVLIRLERGSDGWTATVSSAGHPLPLLRLPDGTVEALGRPGLLLGAEEEASYEEWGVEISPGSCLACFTDGVGDGAEPGRSDGPEATLSRVTGPAARVADAICREAEARQGPQDDLVVLVLAFE
jgi:PAS domain S-box-containing protein